MLRTLDRARPWNISGHVCHSCRIRLLAAEHQQVRRQSTSSPSQANDARDSRAGIPFPLAGDGKDSWLSNFNHLDEDTSKSGKKKKTRRKQDSTAKTNQVENIRKTNADEPVATELENVNQDTNQPPSSPETATPEKKQQLKSWRPVRGRQRRASVKPAEKGLRVPTEFHTWQHGQFDARQLGLPVKRRFGKRLGGQSKKDASVVEALLGQGQTEDAARVEFKNLVKEKEVDVIGEADNKDNDVEGAAKSAVKGREPSRLWGPSKMFQKLLFGQKSSKETGSEQDGPLSSSSLDSTLVQNPSLIYKKMVSGSEPVSTADKDVASSRGIEGNVQPQSNTEETAFGVSKSESTAPGQFPEQSLVSLKSPEFGKTAGNASATPSVQAKERDTGWNLEAASKVVSKEAAAKAKKSLKSSASAKKKKPEKKEQAQKKQLKRRERMQLKSAAKRGASKANAKEPESPKDSKKRKSSKAQEQIESPRTPLPPDAPDPSVSVIEPSALHITPLEIPQPPVPGLEYGLDRVLFNPGVYQLQDPHSRVFNFDPYLQKIMPVVEFDYNALKQYKTSSQDIALADLAKEHSKRYIGSTSSMTGTLGHFHYLLSAWRPLNLAMISRGFPEKLDTFTQINRAPNAIFLRWKNGTYAIDADKEHDGANVLMMLGKSMEKLLTLPTEDFERYRKSDPREVTEEERSEPEAFQYTTMGDFLMRSQLDAYDSRLPGTGMFDLKTRAVVTIRHSTEDFERMTGYQIHTLQGRFESYEREYYDMMRSTMLKYMLQVRMGRMDGIFIAYHNVERIFGFQYVSLQEMDRALHGQINRALGDQEFKASLEMLNRVFDMATEKYPEKSLRFHFESTQEKLASGSTSPMMWVFAEPMEEVEIDRIQDSSKEKIAEFERTMMGMGDSAEQQSTEDVDGDGQADDSTSAERPSNARSTATGVHEAEKQATTSESSPNKAAPPTATTDTNLAPLFTANILFESTVDGTVVDRPENLTDKHNWKVEYIIQERPTDAAMWARYADVKSKRKEIFEKAREEDAEEGEEGKKSKKVNRYREFLGSMSEQGRAFRVKVDRMEKGKVPVVVGRPVVGPEEVVGSEQDGVEGVEQYMEWLYGKI